MMRNKYIYIYSNFIFIFIWDLTEHFRNNIPPNRYRITKLQLHKKKNQSRRRNFLVNILIRIFEGQSRYHDIEFALSLMIFEFNTPARVGTLFCEGRDDLHWNIQKKNESLHRRGTHPCFIMSHRLLPISYKVYHHHCSTSF